MSFEDWREGREEERKRILDLIDEAIKDECNSEFPEERPTYSVLESLKRKIRED